MDKITRFSLQNYTLLAPKLHSPFLAPKFGSKITPFWLQNYTLLAPKLHTFGSKITPFLAPKLHPFWLQNYTLLAPKLHPFWLQNYTLFVIFLLFLTLIDFIETIKYWFFKKRLMNYDSSLCSWEAHCPYNLLWPIGFGSRILLLNLNKVF